MKRFWSDLHFGEENVCKVGLRSKLFSSQQEWEEKCITSLCSNLKRGDVIYLLGDVGTKESLPRLKQAIPRGVQSFLILGNHDPSINICKSIFGQDKVREIHQISIQGHQTILYHFPIIYWHKCHRGSLHLHGHVHDQKTELMQSLFPEMRALDVCPESSIRWLGEFRPFSEDEVLGILLKRGGHDNVCDYKDKE